METAAGTARYSSEQMKIQRDSHTRRVLKSVHFFIEKVARRKLNYMQQFSEEALSDFRCDIR
jgi:hypothetical protein